MNFFRAENGSRYFRRRIVGIHFKILDLLSIFICTHTCKYKSKNNLLKPNTHHENRRSTRENRRYRKGLKKIERLVSQNNQIKRE